MFLFHWPTKPLTTVQPVTAADATFHSASARMISHMIASLQYEEEEDRLGDHCLFAGLGMSEL